MAVGGQGAVGNTRSTGNHLSRVISWWIDELAGMLPVRERRAGSFSRNVLLLAPAQDRMAVLWRDGRGERVLGDIPWSAAGERHQGDAEQLRALVGTTPFARAPQKSRRAGIVLDDSSVLTRDMTFPQVVEDDLRDMLANRMDRISPYGVGRVVFGYTVVGRDAAKRTIDVRVAIVPKGRIEPIVAAAGEAGLDLSFASVACDGGDIAIDLQPPAPAPAKRGTSRALTAILVTANVALAAVYLGQPLLAKAAREADLQEKVATAKLKAELVYRLREKVASLKEEVLFLPNRKQEAVFSIAVLDELSQVLPDETWLEKLILADGEVQLFGMSPLAPSLIGLVEASARFRDVRFSAPVTKGAGSNMDRFHISAVLEGEADGQ